MNSKAKSLQCAVMLMLCLTAFALPIQSQQRELKEIDKCLKEGNCDCALKFYNVYKKIAGHGNKDKERRIDQCREDYIVDRVYFGDYDKAILTYEQGKNSGQHFSEDTESEISNLRLWYSGYYDNCMEEKPCFDAGIAIPMPYISRGNSVMERRLQAIVEFVRNHNDEIENVHVVGFHKPVGSDELCNKISQEAAATVKYRLIELGVEAAKVSSEGKGPHRLLFAGMPYHTTVCVFNESKALAYANSRSAEYVKVSMYSEIEFYSSSLFYTMSSGSKKVGDLNDEYIDYMEESVDEDGKPTLHRVIHFDSDDPYGRCSMEVDRSTDGLEKGTIMWQDGCWYEGEFRNGAINGHGTFHWANGDTYTGGFRNGKKHGQGIYEWATGSYEGMFAYDRMNGKGILTSLGLIYKGDFVNDKRSGHGICFYGYDGWWSAYEGDWKDGLRNGTFKIHEGVTPYFEPEGNEQYGVRRWNMGSPVFDY